MARESTTTMTTTTNGRSGSPRASERNGDTSRGDKFREPSATSDRGLRDRDRDSEKLVYALRNSDKTIELCSENLRCLMPTKYLNDEVVQVYIAYLLYEKCDLDTQRRSHVFDTYFYKLVHDLFVLPNENPTPEQVEEKTRSCKRNWRRLGKWFHGIDLFDKSFLIFPICHDQHWYTIIVCHPSEVPDFEEEPASPDQSSDSRNKPVPGIIVLDSLGCKMPLQTKEVRMFLDFEWRSRCTVVKDFYYHNLKEYKPKLPKQTNSYDCGIFMLAYLKAFLQEPERFYRLVRRNSAADQEALTSMVHMELSYCSRESIRATINKKCKVERSRGR